MKNPKSKADLEHLSPEQLLEDIIEKERKILDTLAQIQQEIGNGVPC